MATSNRTTTIVLSGPPAGTQTIQAAENSASPASITIDSLVASTFKTITVPSASGVTVTAVTIVPPTGNTVSITLKGVTGDTGIALHLTDPTTLALGSAVTSFGLLPGAGAVAGIRFYWT